MSKANTFNLKTVLLIGALAVLSAPSAYFLGRFLSLSPFVSTCFVLGACLAVVKLAASHETPTTPKQEGTAHE